MPLSEHEQRLLDQIERALYAEDPKFASTVRATDLRTHLRRRTRRGVVLFVVGFVLVFAGLVTKLWPISVVGFLLMLLAALGVAASWKRASGREASTTNRRSSRVAPAKPAKAGLMERLEERWRRRRDEPDR